MAAAVVVVEGKGKKEKKKELLGFFPGREIQRGGKGNQVRIKIMYSAG